MNQKDTLEYLKNKYGRLMISQHEAMEELGVKINTMIRLRKSGEIKSKMVGGKAMINIGDLAEYMLDTY